MRTTDWQTFIIAVLVLAACFYGLIFTVDTDGDVRLALAGFAGAVITYFFGRQVAQNAATSTAREMNGSRASYESTTTIHAREPIPPSTPGPGIVG